MPPKRSFFERLTGSIRVEQPRVAPAPKKAAPGPITVAPSDFISEPEEGQLTIDMWQTPEEMVVQTMVGGVKPEDLDVAISHDMVTIRGTREKSREAQANDYFYQELYWGAFSRSILLPQEIDADEAEATIKNGLLTIRLPKLDKTKIQKLKVKNE